MDLPEGLTKLQCHLTWINKVRESIRDPDLDVRFTQCTLAREGVKNKCTVESYQAPDKHDFDLDHLQYKCGDVYFPNYARSLALQINTCAHMLSVGYLDDACQILVKLRSMMPQPTGDHKERLLEVMEYYIQCMEWYKEKICGEKVEDTSKLEKLQEMWIGFQTNTISMAVAYFVRASFLRFNPFGDEIKHLEMLRRVVDMDPDYHVWYQYAYQSIRQVRRNDTKYKCPTSEEVHFCERAFEMAPNSIPNILNRAIMLKDCLRCVNMSTRKSSLVNIGPRTEDFTETLNLCLTLMDESRRSADEQKMYVLHVKASLERVDLLMHVIQTEESCKEGIKLFNELLEIYPSNAVIHHKLGKLYQFGLSLKDGGRLFRDLGKAKHYFKLAMDLRQSNYFIVLGDYIKLFQYLPAPQPSLEALKILREASENTNYFYVFYPCDDIAIWTGLILWIHNPEEKAESRREACGLWLSLFEHRLEPSEKQNELFKRIWRPSFFIPVDGRRVEYKISTDELKEELLQIKEDSSTSSSILAAVEILLKEIARNPQHSSLAAAGSGNMEHSSRRGHSWRTRDFHGQENGETRRMRLPQTKNAFRSVADEDHNWRK